MNKTELIDAIAASTNLPKTDVNKVLGAFSDQITVNVKKGTKTTWPGFLTFEVINRPERQGRNPSTGAPMTIAAKNVVKVKAGKTLQDAVN